MNLQEAREQLSTGQSFVREQRETLARSREEIQGAREKALKDEKTIQKEIKKIPVPSQRLLRQGMYSGIEGRKRRRIVGKIKEDLVGKNLLVGEFKKGLTEKEKELLEYETKELAPYESNLSKLGSEIKAQEKEEKSYRIAQKIIWGETNPLVMMYQPRVKYYYRLLKAQEEVSIPTTTFTAPKTDIPVVNSKVILPLGGFSSAFINKLPQSSYTCPIEPQSSYTCPIEPQICSVDTSPKTKITNTPFNIGSLYGVSSNDFKDISNIKSITSPKIDSFAISKGKDGLFLTTGSPKRYTKLYSGSARRPPTPSKPSMNKSILKYPKKVKGETSKLGKSSTQKGKVKSKGKFDFFFGEGSKTKKRNSLWGF